LSEPGRNMGAVAAGPRASAVRQGDVRVQRCMPLDNGAMQRGGQGAGGRNVEATVAAASRCEAMVQVSASKPTR
jgi:hypothetical protein